MPGQGIDEYPLGITRILDSAVSQPRNIVFSTLFDPGELREQANPGRSQQIALYAVDENRIFARDEALGVVGLGGAPNSKTRFAPAHFQGSWNAVLRGQVGD